jgi:hypothetical protein
MVKNAEKMKNEDAAKKVNKIINSLIGNGWNEKRRRILNL